MSNQHIDLHQIQLKYAHTRILDQKSIYKMMRSLESFGQKAPVILVSGSGKYILIDGYTRIRALKKLGKDTVWADILGMEEKAALLLLLNKQGHNKCIPLEQACIIQELKTGFGLSLTQIAAELCRDKSFVKRRLDMLEALPEDILSMVRDGHILPWSASRVLAPLARANKEHALKLSRYCVHHPCSSRELKEFFDAYKTSTKVVRENMIDNPGLFIKAWQNKKQDQQALLVRLGPEGKWIKDMKVVCAILRKLVSKTRAVFASIKEEDSKQAALLKQAEDHMTELAANAEKGKDDAYAANQRDHSPDAPERDRHQRDRQAA